MADLEDSYRQLSWNGLGGSGAATLRHWRKVFAALIGGSCLLLAPRATTSISRLRLRSSPAIVLGRPCLRFSPEIAKPLQRPVAALRSPSHYSRSAVRVQARVAASTGRVLTFPRDYGDVTIQCQRAVQAALDDGKALIEVEFPTGSLLNVPGDIEGGVEMDLSSGYIKNIVRGFADDRSRVLFPDREDEARQTSSEEAPFAGGKYRTGYLFEPSGLMDMGINLDKLRGKKVSNRCASDDSLFVVAYPHFNVEEMLCVQELYEDLAKEKCLPIVIINGELDRIRSGYYPSLFYPKIGKLSKELMPKVDGAYYIHNFKGSKPGVLFRCYPGPWQVLRRSGPDLSEVVLIQEFDSMPTLRQVSELLSQS